MATGMYDRRVKVFIGICVTVLLLCVLRLAQMQLLAQSEVQSEIARIKERNGLSRQLKTLRGTILDRHGNALAVDTPRFQVYVNYRLSCYLDERVVQALVAQAKRENADPALEEVLDDVHGRVQELKRVVQECSQFGADPDQLLATLTARNDKIWNLRRYLAWYRGAHDPNLIAKYGKREDVPFGEAMADLESQFSDPNERYRYVVNKVDDIPELQRDLPLAELPTDDAVFAAQVEFREIPDVQVLPTGHRDYPYSSVAAQTIGWVGPATQERDTELFEDDPLASYLAGEVCGREGGVEYVCETLLRGRRGELVYDIDRQLIRETETEFGRDVQLTLDIELQKRIEEYLSDPKNNPDYCRAPMAAAIIDVGSGDILALVSLPTYDLNVARYRYGDLLQDPNRPLINRTINRNYPPGSIVKPLILIAGLESGVITPEEPISCPPRLQPKGWPSCLIERQGAGHDEMWVNNARNALKGSCNVYFSRLADRIEPRTLQEWLFRFGYGRQIPLPCPGPPDPGAGIRSFRQSPGEIGSSLIPPYTDVESLDQIPPLQSWHRRLFGIGHANFRVTPLQAANTFATLARGGRHITPHLFLRPAPPASETVDLPISPTSLATARDGMSAVVNESGGTAHKAFEGSSLFARGVHVWGKTGSTEKPDDAWFAGYAQDRRGAKIAVAMVVEGGQRGSSDAAPLGRAVLELCADAGYLGN